MEDHKKNSSEFSGTANYHSKNHGDFLGETN